MDRTFSVVDIGALREVVVMYVDFGGDERRLSEMGGKVGLNVRTK